MKRRVGILISGRGSNMAALVAASRDPTFPVEFVLVLSNREQAPGIALAASLGVPTAVVPHRLFGSDRAAHEAAIDAALVAADVQIVCLAGYMRLLTPFLVQRWAGGGLDMADARDGLALLAQQRRRGFHVGVGDHHGHADAAVEHPQHFLGGNPAGTGQPDEDRRQLPGAGVDHGAGAGG